jgi:hypothetical protein
MTAFDYGTKADLFVSRRALSRQKPLEYKSFQFARDAIRYAMEQLSPERLGGICMEIDERRYGSDEIRTLYESEAYPLERRATTLRLEKRRRPCA